MYAIRSYYVLVAVINGFEFAAIDRHNGLAEQVELAAEDHKSLAHITDAFAVIVTEVGDGLEVRGELSCEPHQFNIALRFALQFQTRLDLVQVTVDVDLQK